MITSVYPVLMSESPAATAGFFVEHFGFEITFEAEWYVSLQHGSHELAVVDATHDTIPDDHRSLAAGVLVNIEVDDVDTLHRTLTQSNVPVARPLRSEEFGQRHVIVVAPGNVLVDVIEPIEPTGEYA